MSEGEGKTRAVRGSKPEIRTERTLLVREGEFLGADEGMRQGVLPPQPIENERGLPSGKVYALACA